MRHRKQQWPTNVRNLFWLVTRGDIDQTDFVVVVGWKEVFRLFFPSKQLFVSLSLPNRFVLHLKSTFCYEQCNSTYCCQSFCYITFTIYFNLLIYDSSCEFVKFECWLALVVSHVRYVNFKLFCCFNGFDDDCCDCPFLSVLWEVKLTCDSILPYFVLEWIVELV